MSKDEMIYDALDLIEEVENVSDKSKEKFIEKYDELKMLLNSFDEQATAELVEILTEDYSDNWVAKEVIKYATNR